MKVWKPFRKSSTVRIACFALAGALLVASALGLWRSSAGPGEVTIPGASYEHKGTFDYQVYLKPNTLYGEFIPPEEKEAAETKEETPLVFFRDIIDETRLAFSYKFDCSEPVANVTNDVVVTITAENPGVWQKEITVLEETRTGTEFRVDFPLFLDSLDSVVDDIEEDIGITSSVRNFIIRAVVHTSAETASGKIIKNDFSHEITAILKQKTLELDGDLKGSDNGSVEGVKYEEEGWFDYEVYLEYNSLYESGVLRSEPLPVAEPPASPTSLPQTLGPGLVYFPNIIDNITATLSYQFNCDKPIRAQSGEVEITATIGKPKQVEQEPCLDA